MTKPGYAHRRITGDYLAEIALGNVTGRSCVAKFGHAPDGMQTTETDIYDGANSTAAAPTWVAPTAARVHAVTSTSAEDVAGQDGATAVTVYGLTDWDTKEVSESVTLNGTANVNTDNAYVIIHRMKAVAQASTASTSKGVNVGVITATAASDATVTARILAANGQTEMAIYGVPSVQKALLYSWYGQIDKSQGAVSAADFLLRVNENPDVQLFGFLRKADLSVQSTGNNSVFRQHRPPLRFDGPCIIKIRASASANDLDGEAGFDLVLVDN